MKRFQLFLTGLRRRPPSMSDDALVSKMDAIDRHLVDLANSQAETTDELRQAFAPKPAWRSLIQDGEGLLAYLVVSVGIAFILGQAYVQSYYEQMSIPRLMAHLIEFDIQWAGARIFFVVAVILVVVSAGAQVIILIVRPLAKMGRWVGLTLGRAFGKARERFGHPRINTLLGNLRRVGTRFRGWLEYQDRHNVRPILIILIVISSVTIGRQLAASGGQQQAIRDLALPQLIDIEATHPLQLGQPPDGTSTSDAGEQRWMYRDLKLVTHSEGHYFLYDSLDSSGRPQHIFAVPDSTVIAARLHQYTKPDPETKILLEYRINLYPEINESRLRVEEDRTFALDSSLPILVSHTFPLDTEIRSVYSLNEKGKTYIQDYSTQVHDTRLQVSFQLPSRHYQIVYSLSYRDDIEGHYPEFPGLRTAVVGWSASDPAARTILTIREPADAIEFMLLLPETSVSREESGRVYHSQEFLYTSADQNISCVFGYSYLKPPVTKTTQ